MTFHSITITDDAKKREPFDLDRIHRIIDWAAENIEIQSTGKRHYSKHQRFVPLDQQNILANAVRIVLGESRSYEHHLTYQLIYIRISILQKKMMTCLRTCERELRIILGENELLRATSKFARAPPNKI